MKRPPVRRSFRDEGRSSGAFDQRNDDQNNHGADDGVNNRADDTRAEMDTESRQQPPRYHRADNADDDISEQAEAAALHDQAGKPARNGAYDKPNDNGLDTHGIS